MRQVTLDTTLPNLTLRKEGGPQRISTGALVGKTLEFGDEKTFVMPKEVLVATIIHYDFAQRCFFNSNTGHRVDSMDFALLDSGLVVGGWINRI
ncbi:MAG: hypothetical protein QG594_2285 [Bacteroidota bacterium]|nr:hypothetical protein [Bacteroidota bacterium]